MAIILHRLNSVSWFYDTHLFQEGMLTTDIPFIVSNVIKVEENLLYSPLFRYDFLSKSSTNSFRILRYGNIIIYVKLKVSTLMETVCGAWSRLYLGVLFGFKREYWLLFGNCLMAKLFTWFVTVIFTDISPVQMSVDKSSLEYEFGTIE